MSTALYHGPKSLKKQKIFLESFYKNIDKTLVLTSNHNFAQQIKTLLLEETSLPALIGQTVQYWEPFLLDCIKKNQHGGHLADPLMCQYLLFQLLLETPQSNHLTQSETFFEAKDFYSLFIQIKKCGFSKLSNHILSANYDRTKAQKLFENYNELLKSKRFFDDGDLYKTPLDLLKNKDFKLPSQIENLILFENYPLSPGQRQILRGFKQNFPNLNITIFYDEDFSRASDWLSFAYEELGEIADQSEFIPLTQSHDHSLFEFSSPTEELDFVIKSIQKDLKNDFCLHDIVIAVSEETLELAQYTLKKQNLAYTQTFSKPIQKILPDCGNENILQQIKESTWAQETFYAKEAVLKLKNQIDFIDDLFSEKLPTLSKNNKNFFLNKTCENLSYRIPKNTHQILLTTHEQALSYQDRKKYYTGLYLENFTKNTQKDFYATSLLQNKEWAELLNLPHYQLKIFQQKLIQNLENQTHFVLTRPLYNLSGKETTRFALKPIKNYIKKPDTPSPTYNLNRNYNSFAKNIFSPSKLQAYNKCPYVFYAKYVLGLEEKDKIELEPDPKSKGNLVHSLLQNLYEKHFPQIEKFYSKDIPEDYLVQIITQELETLIKSHPDFIEKEDSVIKLYQKRVVNAVVDFLEVESKLVNDQGKKTRPHLFEWGFSFSVHNKTIKGRIDRVDCYKNEYTIFDYKTGSNLPSGPDIKKLKDLQIPLYLKAIEENLKNNAKINAGLYYSLKTSKLIGLALAQSCDEKILKKQNIISENQWSELKKDLNQKLKDIFTGIENANFRPKPLSSAECRNCAFKRICGYHHKDFLKTESL